MKRLLKTICGCLLCSAVTHEASAQYVAVGPEVVVGIGGGILASSYSYTTAWPGSFVTPSYVALPPLAPAYVIPARVTPFRGVRAIGHAMPVFNPPMLVPFP